MLWILAFHRINFIFALRKTNIIGTFAAPQQMATLPNKYYLSTINISTTVGLRCQLTYMYHFWLLSYVELACYCK